MSKKIKQGAEGLVIIALGLFLLINSLLIKANPIPQEGWAGVLSQAKLVPTVMSAGILILGTILFVKQMKGQDKSNQLTKAEWTRLGVVMLLTTVYVVCVYFFKFLIQTVVFALAIFAFLNWKKRKVLHIVFFAILAVALGLYGMPLLINMKLPML